MSKNSNPSANDHPSVLHLEEVRRTKKSPDPNSQPVRIKVEVACDEPTGSIIRNRLGSTFESKGCLVVADDKPDWILSVIAFAHGNLVELSIVLRRLFRSTVPGTEVEEIDAEGRTRLREGGWLYESLRFHGLFGVPRMELEAFLAQLVADFAKRHWESQIPATQRQ